MWLEIVKVVILYAYFNTIIEFVKVIIMRKTKEKGYMTEKEYYHALHEAMEKMCCNCSKEAKKKSE